MGQRGTTPWTRRIGYPRHVISHTDMRDSKAYFYDTLADQWEAVANPYETARRLEIVFDEILSAHDLHSRTLLDVGAGPGFFSKRAVDRGAHVTALDIGHSLVRKVRDRCNAAVLTGDACNIPLASDTFDFVVSSECIEHTPDPHLALREIHRVTRPGGLMLITVPNRAWRFAMTIADVLKVRKYDGHENWIAWSEMKDALTATGSTILHMQGFNLFPPLLKPTWPLLRRLDAFGKRIGPVMLNIAVLARK